MEAEDDGFVDFHDAYFFLRTTVDADDLLTTLDVPGSTVIRFALVTGPHARLFVLKQDDFDGLRNHYDTLAALDADKALSVPCIPQRIVHLGPFQHMASSRSGSSRTRIDAPCLRRSATWRRSRAGRWSTASITSSWSSGTTIRPTRSFGGHGPWRTNPVGSDLVGRRLPLPVSSGPERALAFDHRPGVKCASQGAPVEEVR